MPVTCATCRSQDAVRGSWPVEIHGTPLSSRHDYSVRTGEEIYVFVDETGDLGFSGSASPIFGFAAVLIPDTSRAQAISAVVQLREDFKVPTDQVLSWKKYATNHDRRRRAAEVLAALHEVRVCFVYVNKSELRPNSYARDRCYFYNYAAGKLLKSVLWASRNWKSNSCKVWVRFGHVKDLDHATTAEYLRDLIASDAKVPDHLVQSMRWFPADAHIEQQLADLYAGILKSAIWPAGDFGYVEGSYLRTVWHQIVASDSCAIPLGLMSMPANELVTRQPWFPCSHCRHRSAR